MLTRASMRTMTTSASALNDAIGATALVRKEPNARMEASTTRRLAAGMSMTLAATTMEATTEFFLITATTAASYKWPAAACAMPPGLKASSARLGKIATRTLGGTSASVSDSVGCQICLGTTPGLACVTVDFRIATNCASDAFS